jgi:hypothetical protein
MKKNITLLTLLIITTCSFGQGGKFIHSLKYGTFTEYLFAPTSYIVTGESTDYNSSTGQYETTDRYELDRKFSISIINLVYTARFNAYEPSDDFGIGINASPSLGLAYGDAGFGSINIPVYPSLNFGAGSTYSTASNFGGFFGIGFEFTKIGLFGVGEDSETTLISTSVQDVDKATTAWIEPMFIGGIRWWTANDKLMEVSIKYGFGSNGDLDLPPGTTLNGGNPRTIQLSWGYFLGY